MDIISYALSKGNTQKAVTDYLDEHLTNPTNPPIDTSLSIAGAAADSKKTGDEIATLKEDLNIIGVSTETVDFSEYDTINGTMQSNGRWGSINLSSYQSALITDIPIKMTVKAKTDRNAYISFFTKKPSQPSTVIDEIFFCEGETGRHTIPMGTEETFILPSDCKCIVVTVKSSNNDYTPTIKGFYAGGLIGELNAKIATNTEEITAFKELQNKPSVFVDENRNMCLAGIKTDILTDKIPYHRGFLFHKLQNNDGSLWYGTDFRNIFKIGSVSFNPNSMRFAISPKDGRIIAVQRDTRNGIYVWDGETETHVTGFTLEPMAWLYNSGVDFINDGTDEYCIFAEYKSGEPFDSFNVWRGKYPYTSVSDWEIVLTQTPTDITHFHMIRRDPWSNILYLTSGDDSAKCKWWYSTDCGATWILLTTGSTSGYEDHICRCINFIFTKDYIYWATDKGSNHCLNRVSRDSNGIIDVSSREKLCDLPSSVATNSICYVESPHGIFMYDRIDIGYTTDYGKPVPMSFWDIDKAELTTPFIVPLIVDDWGGSRGKCYVNYTNSKQTMPAMGFSINTPCIFDLVCDNPSRIGTIAYEIGSKTIHTVDY